MATVAALLNAEGHRNRAGRVWSPQLVHHVLRRAQKIHGRPASAFIRAEEWIIRFGARGFPERGRDLLPVHRLNAPVAMPPFQDLNLALGDCPYSCAKQTTGGFTRPVEQSKSTVKSGRASPLLIDPRSAGSRTFVVDLPANHLGPSWRRKLV